MPPFKCEVSSSSHSFQEKPTLNTSSLTSGHRGQNLRSFKLKPHLVASLTISHGNPIQSGLTLAAVVGSPIKAEIELISSAFKTEGTGQEKSVKRISKGLQLLFSSMAKRFRSFPRTTFIWLSIFALIERIASHLLKQAEDRHKAVHVVRRHFKNGRKIAAIMRRWIQRTLIISRKWRNEWAKQIYSES